MSIHKRLPTLVLAVLVATALVLWASSAVAVNATRFSQQGTYVSGWYWMTSNGLANTWTFNPPSAAEVNSFQGCELQLDALVTNTTSGGGGHNKKVDQYLYLSTGTPPGPEQRFKIELVNKSMTVTWTDSHGKDYAAKRVFLNPSEMTPTDRANLQKVCDSYMAARDTKKYGQPQALNVRYAWAPTTEACCAGKPPAPHHVAVNQTSVQVYFWK
jgi:hypothetical protein